MASRRCPDHLVRYPFTMVKQGGGCPVVGCDTPQESHPHISPHADWSLKVSTLTMLYLGGYPSEPDPPMDLQPFRLGPPPQFWLSHKDLLRCGYEFRKDVTFGLVRSLGRFYELQGWDKSKKRWLVEIVEPEWALRHVPALDYEPERVWREPPEDEQCVPA